MAYFAAAFAMSDDEWHVYELELDGVESIDDVADELVQIATATGSVAVLVEADEWFGLIRIDEDEDPQAFVSDAFEAAQTALGRALLAALSDDEPSVGPGRSADDEVDVELHDDLDGEPGQPAGPLGSADLFAGLGLGAGDLESIAAKSGYTPIDALGEVARRIGVGDLLEELR